jgi:hypothetical protein
MANICSKTSLKSNDLSSLKKEFNFIRKEVCNSLSGSSGAGDFTELSGTTWDGTNKYYELTGDLSLTLDTTENAGVIYLVQDGTGGHTVSINGVAITINSGANTDSAIGFMKINGEYILTVDLSVINLSHTPATPDAPTNGVVDDTADTFDWTNNPLFTSVSDYEYTLNAGSSYSALLAKPLVVGDVNEAIGQVGIRVKAIGINNPSATLYNASAFNAVPSAGTWADAADGFTINDQDLTLTASPESAKYSKFLANGDDGYIRQTVDMGAGYGQGVFMGLAQGDTFEAVGDWDYGIGASYASNPALPTIYRYINGAPSGNIIAVADGDTLEIERSGSDIIFKHNGAAIHTISGTGFTGDLYVKAFASSPNPIRLRGFVTNGLT